MASNLRRIVPGILARDRREAGTTNMRHTRIGVVLVEFGTDDLYEAAARFGGGHGGSRMCRTKERTSSFEVRSWNVWDPLAEVSQHLAGS
ncbi:MAG: hypothetical protein F4089_11030 [Gammaproteobacteria bacterium]|nr:hypothetical protein [Gammaproteobacteria bacterium]